MLTLSRRDIKFATSVPLASSEIVLHKTFMDTIGRPTLKLSAINLGDNWRDRDLVVSRAPRFFHIIVKSSPEFFLMGANSAKQSSRSRMNTPGRLVCASQSPSSRSCSPSSLRHGQSGAWTSAYRRRRLRRRRNVSFYIKLLHSPTPFTGRRPVIGEGLLFRKNVQLWDLDSAFKVRK